MGDARKYRSYLNDGRREIARTPTFSLAREGSSTVCLFVDAGARAAPVHVAGRWLASAAGAAESAHRDSDSAP